jgi:hypothetical protein
MKPKFMKVVTIVTAFILLFTVNLFAQRKVKSTGIGLRVTHWKMTNDQTRIIVSDYGSRSSVETGSGGVWLYLLSRMNHNTLFELSLGAVGKVEEETYYYTHSDVDVFAVTPILLGLRIELMSPESQSALQPYLSLGGGPYWFSNVSVKERMYEDEVKVETKLKRGGYLGGGVNFLLSDWFAINFDMKYHFIDFNKKHENSGFEYGLGVSFMWGRFR